MKDIWIRSGKTAGDGPASNFAGRGAKHLDNSKKLEEMKKSKLYRLYPGRMAANLGARDGYFDELDTYCGMAFDRTNDVEALCSVNKEDSLLVWSERTIKELEAKGESPHKVQLVAVAYLWEFVYGLLLASGDNVFKEPGFESLGLRWNVLGGRVSED